MSLGLKDSLPLNNRLFSSIFKIYVDLLEGHLAFYLKIGYPKSISGLFMDYMDGSVGSNALRRYLLSKSPFPGKNTIGFLAPSGFG